MPTSNCATSNASPMFTTPSPFTSPQTPGFVVVVVLVLVVVVTVLVVGVVVVVLVVVIRLVLVVLVVAVVVGVVVVVLLVVVGNVPSDSYAPMSQTLLPSPFPSSGRRTPR